MLCRWKSHISVLILVSAALGGQLVIPLTERGGDREAGSLGTGLGFSSSSSPSLVPTFLGGAIQRVGF